MSKLIEKLMKRWGVESYGGLLLILVIFSLTGITVLYVRKFMFGWIGVNAETPILVEIVAWIIIVFPAYQVLLLLYGFILGQFEFVWNFEKKSLHRIKSLFVRGENTQP
ncbi:hypothetical protein SAMN05443144_103131 [Fodinibius roseus]|uniref:DUF6787 domain-containing protein n=1 Tax=Fodinibius roseus TaxID=1194090 RepID=A0A1M4W660_9BACT|nr:DUF6787 family protein [Fodinibius roseus]SHE76640.1 hypothetical protein SAMN05443144_103131 [Fodinibius roseus]